MLSLVLASVSPAEHSAGPQELLEQFGIQPAYLAMQMISFVIIAFVFHRFMIKPLILTMEERQKKIETGLKDAADIKAKLSATHQETMQILQKAHAEATEIIDNARKTSKEVSDRESKMATERSNEMFAKAQQAIELEHKRMMQEARGEITRLVVATTQKVLAKELSDFERARFNEAASKELTNV
ncbi:MAG: F0F1 ATP synthase subunit B [Opitutaceae bacterium]|jgi:F-type H+-transporting ATPase subunit b